MNLDVLRWFRHRLDVIVGHNLVMANVVGDVPLLGDWLQDSWYRHVCLPTALWECHDLPDLSP